MDLNLGQAVQNGILDSNQITSWNKLKFTDVGISRDSIELFHDLMVRMNNQRRVAHTPMEMWIKFHQQITFPRVLADRSLNELMFPHMRYCRRLTQRGTARPAHVR